MNLSQDFTIDEFTRSQYAIRHGIANRPNELHVRHLKALAINVLQPIRDYFGRPVIISSGFRSSDLNRGVNGNKNSLHMFGMAADFTVLDNSIREVMEWTVRESGLEYDQIILEFDQWIHVSYRSDCRKEALISCRDDMGNVCYWRY